MSNPKKLPDAGLTASGDRLAGAIARINEFPSSPARERAVSVETTIGNWVG